MADDSPVSRRWHTTVLQWKSLRGLLRFINFQFDAIDLSFASKQVQHRFVDSPIGLKCTERKSNAAELVGSEQIDFFAVPRFEFCESSQASLCQCPNTDKLFGQDLLGILGHVVLEKSDTKQPSKRRSLLLVHLSTSWSLPIRGRLVKRQTPPILACPPRQSAEKRVEVDVRYDLVKILPSTTNELRGGHCRGDHRLSTRNSRTKIMITESETQEQYCIGSHLVVNLGLYDHHGVYGGQRKVIHFGRGIFDPENAVVEVVDLEIFGNGNPIKVCESKTKFMPDEIVDRARNRIGESGYDLFENNCEHFVNWCRSGEHESKQVNFSETVARQTAAVAAKPLIRNWAVNVASKRIGALTVGLARGPAIVAGVADAVQATAEIVATRQGKTKQQSRQIGQQVGLASSAALGWTVGGPVIAVAGVGFWLMGQIIANQTLKSGKLVIAAAIGQATAYKTSAHSSSV